MKLKKKKPMIMITVRKCNTGKEKGYYAHSDDIGGQNGRTKAEAIGKLIISFAEENTDKIVIKVLPQNG